jgi:hypothetical protein
MDPQLKTVLILAGYYVVLAIITNLIARVGEVLCYLRKMDDNGWLYKVEGIKRAWAFEASYDDSMFGYVFFFFLWPMGLLIMPFYYYSEWMYLLRLPFKHTNIVPKWLTLGSIVEKMNARRSKNQRLL